MRVATIIAIAVVALDTSAAFSQPVSSKLPSEQAKTAFALPPESVTVTVTKPSEETIENFVETRAAPTRFLGKMARWRRGICPLTVGLGDKYATYVSQRIRDVATAVGAPVSDDPTCKPNIEVVFTTKPQDFMDNVRKSGPAFLGYYDNYGQADNMAKVTHPIQAWYTTESLDNNANPQIDTGRCGGTTLNILPLDIPASDPDFQGPQGGVTLNLSCARVMAWSGSRLGNSFDSGFHNALIVAEPAKLTEYEMETVADYVTMLALSQQASLDCQKLPSISNLLAKGCVSAPTKITYGDLAYLQGLYKVPAGYAFSGQRNQIRYEMKKILVSDNGGAD